ncbi:MAG TPA: NTP transferase domain-containing protein [Candidatus Binataceae bacterium]|nr:NTP transferase domain-containing protein [Candidatus Binataceae bacterium]
MKLQGAIIAAGRGERLRASGADLPKPLVELGGDTMLARQARALLDAGASSVLAIVNSETARIADELKLPVPPSVKVVVRDTANSMETMLTLGEFIEPGWFIAATVDAIVPQAEMSRFVREAQRKIASCGDQRIAGALAVTQWRGDRKPLFANVNQGGLITHLGSEQNLFVTAGLYFLHTRIFDLAGDARRAGLDALRRFLALLIDNQMNLHAIEIEGAIDVDELNDLDAARRAIRSIQ